MLGPIAKRTVRTSGVLGARLVAQVATLLVVARLLGPAQFGAFAGVAASAVVLGALASCGMHLVLMVELSKDSSKRVQVLNYALPATLAGGVFFLAVFLVLSRHLIPDSEMDWRLLLAIGTADIVLMPLLNLVVAEHVAAERTARSQILQTMPLVLRLLMAFLVSALQSANPLEVYVYGYVGATLAATVGCIALISSRWPHPRDWRRPSRREWRHASGYAVLGATALGPGELDKTMAAGLLPLPVAGLYSVGARVVGAATLPIVAMQLSALPRLFREGTGRQRDVMRLLRWILGVTTIYGVALAIVLWWCAPLVTWLFGSTYQGLDDAIRHLCVALPGMTVRLASGSTLMGLGRPWLRAGLEALGLAVLAIAASILAPRHGLSGMVLALACSEWAMGILGTWSAIHVVTRAKYAESATQPDRPT